MLAEETEGGAEGGEGKHPEKHRPQRVTTMIIIMMRIIKTTVVTLQKFTV